MAESTGDVTNIPNVFVTEEVRDLDLTYDGSSFTLKIKDIPWSKTNQIIAKCTSYSNTGQVGVNLDQFYREYLVLSVRDSPWGPFTNEIVNRFTQPFGDLLVSALIPSISPVLPGGESEEHFFEPKSEPVS